jgi:hypothetical protein
VTLLSCDTLVPHALEPMLSAYDALCLSLLLIHPLSVCRSARCDLSLSRARALALSRARARSRTRRDYVPVWPLACVRVDMEFAGIICVTCVCSCVCPCVCPLVCLFECVFVCVCVCLCVCH